MKALALLVLVVLCASLVTLHFHGKAMRRAARYNAYVQLHHVRTFAEENQGVLTNPAPSSMEVFYYTNTIRVGDTNYMCSLAMRWRSSASHFEKQIAEDRRISITALEYRFDSNSPEARALRESWRQSLIRQVGSKAAPDFSVPDPIGWKTLVLTMNPAGLGEGSTIWTNTLCLYAESEVGLRTLSVFDAAEVEGDLFLCYKSGPSIFVEQIPPQASAQRERFHLARDYDVNVWTSASFTVATNGNHTLTARGSKDATLVWEYKDGEWVIELERCQPAFERARAYWDWALASLDGDRWITKKEAPDTTLKGDPPPTFEWTLPEQ